MKQNIKWVIVLVVAVITLGAYCYYSNEISFIQRDKLSIVELKENVVDYINDPNLEVSDIFIYENSNYYFSIEEKDSGRGAFELLVNPYTGRIRPERGPNMVWNEKYRMHRLNEQNNGNVISLEEAIDYANNDLENDNYVNGDGHHFYGYYTFHVFDKTDQVIGMLSVNEHDGQVWYHTWHGELERIITQHD